MDSFTKFDNMFDVKKPADRTEIPVFPQIITWCGTATGVKQSEICASPKLWRKKMTELFEITGTPDVVWPTAPGQAAFLMSLPVRLPGKQLDDNALYQFIETENMTQADYELIKEKGWNEFFYKYIARIQNPPLRSSTQALFGFIKNGMGMQKNIKYFRKLGIANIYDYGQYTAFDILSLIRSMGPFFSDILEDEYPIHDVLQRMTDDLIKDCIDNTSRFKGKRICLFPMRSSCSFISPSMFEEYSWPYLKQMIEALYAAGFRCVIHADGNWTPLMHYFTEVPKGSCHIELDGSGDIIQSYEALDGMQSIRGDVPASMLAFGTPDDVSEYCEKLISSIGMKGGFMLGSACEVPMNAKPENVRAMIQSVR